MKIGNRESKWRSVFFDAGRAHRSDKRSGVGAQAAPIGTKEIISPKLKIAFWIAIALIVILLVLPVILSKASPVPLLLGLVALAMAFIIPLVLARRRLSFMAAWLAFYIIAYFILSWRGAYISHNLGGMDNRETWFPAYCGESYISRVGRQKAHLTTVGLFFLPLVIVDRTLIHRTHFNAW